MDNSKLNERFSDKRLKESQQKLKEKECGQGKHDWSNWYDTAAGLARECRICGKVEGHPKYYRR